MDGEGSGKYRVTRPSFFRRLLIDSLDAIPRGHTMTAPLEFDITEARAAVRKLRREGRNITLFFFSSNR